MLFGKNKWKPMVGERKRVEQMLQHLGMISEKTEEGIVVVDLNGNIHFANTAWAKLHGYGTSKQLLGKHIRAFHNMTQMQSSVTPCLEQTKHQGEYAGEIEHVRRNGNTFLTHTKMVALKDEKGEPAGIMIFAEDISELKRLRDKFNETAAQMEKMKEQIGQFRNQIAERERTENELQKYCDQLEQSFEELAAEAGAAQPQAAPKDMVRESSPHRSANPDPHKPQPSGEPPAEKVAYKPEHVGKPSITSARDAEESEDGQEQQEMAVALDPKKLKAIADLARRLR
jgi:PAS domain S-box-containing protein